MILIVEVAIAVTVAVILELLITKYLRRFSEKKELPPDVGNGLVLVSRFLILIGAIAAVLRIGDIFTIQPEFLRGITAAWDKTIRVLS